MNNDIDVIIPVYNEKNTILELLKKVDENRSNFINEVIVIDDKSTDGTSDILDKNNILFNKIIKNNKNSGKGASVKKGLKVSKAKYVIFQDADLEYDPVEFTKFNKIIQKFEPDLIIGSRLNYDEYSRSHNFYNKLGNLFITNLFNLKNNTTFTDIYSCYICFKRELLNVNDLKTNGFEQQAEILKHIVRNGKIFYEIKINYNGRTIAEGKKIKWYNIFAVIYQILKFW